MFVRSNKVFVSVDKDHVDYSGYDTVSRERVYTLPADTLSMGFRDPRGMLTAEQIKT